MMDYPVPHDMVVMPAMSAVAHVVPHAVFYRRCLNYWRRGRRRRSIFGYRGRWRRWRRRRLAGGEHRQAGNDEE